MSAKKTTKKTTKKAAKKTAKKTVKKVVKKTAKKSTKKPAAKKVSVADQLRAEMAALTNEELASLREDLLGRMFPPNDLGHRGELVDDDTCSTCLTLPERVASGSLPVDLVDDYMVLTSDGTFVDVPQTSTLCLRWMPERADEATFSVEVVARDEMADQDLIETPEAQNAERQATRMVEHFLDRVAKHARTLGVSTEEVLEALEDERQSLEPEFDDDLDDGGLVFDDGAEWSDWPPCDNWSNY